MEILRHAGWEVPLSECTWSATVADEFKFDIVIEGVVIKRAMRDAGFKVLGTIVTMDNNFAKEVANRIARAWAAFSVHRDLFLHKQGSIKKRLMLLDMTVKQALLWGAGAWNLTTKQEQNIFGVQRKMIRIMLRIRMSRDEGMESYMRRCEVMVNEAMLRHDVESWVHSWRKPQFQWAAKIAMQGSSDKARITDTVL